MSAAKKQSRAESSLHGFFALSGDHGIATHYIFRSFFRNILLAYSPISIVKVAHDGQFLGS
jgi:hypothetical protein